MQADNSFSMRCVGKRGRKRGSTLNALRAGGFDTLTIDTENGVLWAGCVAIRVSHDDNYILGIEVGHDCRPGETAADALAIITDRLEDLTDSSVVVGDPIIDETVGQVRVPLERECKCIDDVVRWCGWWTEAA